METLKTKLTKTDRLAEKATYRAPSAPPKDLPAYIIYSPISKVLLYNIISIVNHIIKKSLEFSTPHFVILGDTH